MTRKKLGGFGRLEWKEDVGVTQQQDSDPDTSSARYSGDIPLFLFIKTVFSVFNEFALNLFVRRNVIFLVAAY